MAPQRIGVIGAGTMGSGITYVAVLAGFEVRLTDASPEQLARGMERIGRDFEQGLARGKITPALRDAALTRLIGTSSLAEAVAGADLAIEAVPEELELKRELFRQIEAAAPPTALLATNTSALSVTRIADATAHPERVVGMHFFNPVRAMKLVEIVRAELTSEDAVDRARHFAVALGKEPIVVRDAPGFATSRLGVVLGLEAIRMVEQGVAAPADIDRAMELGYNHPMGPLRLGDLVGLDVRLAIADHLHAALGGDTYRAPDLLRQMVADGKLGRKTGQGFYQWDSR